MDAGRAAREYHERTKHSPASVRASRHVLDWEIQPLPYKIYPDLTPLALPRAWPPASMPTLDAVGAAPPVPGAASAPAALSLPALARLLHLTAGIVRKATYAGGREMYYRAAACTGALYHVDVYLCCGALPDLAAGVHHFAPHDFALRTLRAGDHRARLAAAAADEPAVGAAPCTLVLASTYWRNAWKYQARAWRHCFWDAGTMLANVLAAAAAVALPARLVVGFVDGSVETLLGLDPAREGALALVALGGAPGPLPPAPAAPPLALATVPLSAREVDYPAIRAAQAASSLATPAAVAAWRAAGRAARPVPADPGGAPAHALPTTDAPPSAPLDEVIHRRGSARQFAHAPIPEAALAAMLARATAPIPADVGLGGTAALTAPYLIVHAVEGLPAGSYAYDRARHALVPLRQGDLRRAAAFLDLGQELAGDAAVDVYLLADLARVLAPLGDRGYRAAALEAAIVGGRLYLAAYALGLGATGLTFFDDEVSAFFAPPAAGASVMFLVAIGRPRRRTLPLA